MWCADPGAGCGDTGEWSGCRRSCRSVVVQAIWEWGRGSPSWERIDQTLGMDDAPRDPVDDAAGRTDFECPRCGAGTTGSFYGPCEDCRAALRASMRRDAEDVVAADYEPKMNVTPNAVALKD